MKPGPLLRRGCTVLALALAAGVSPAAPVMVGDTDFFGNGIVGQSGDGFDSIYGVMSDSPVDGPTDVVSYDTVSLRFQFTLPAEGIESARLVVFAGGWGSMGERARVTFGSHEVGLLTDGDDETSPNPFEAETAHLDEFLLDLSQVVLTGDDTFVIHIFQDPAGLNLDFGAVDYAYLDLTPRSGPGAGTVPEPSGLALAGLGLAAAALVRRRRPA